MKAHACPSSPCPWDKLFRGFYDRHDPVIRYVLALACRCGFTLGLNGGGGDGIENESKRQKCRYAAGLGCPHTGDPSDPPTRCRRSKQTLRASHTFSSVAHKAHGGRCRTYQSRGGKSDFHQLETIAALALAAVVVIVADLARACRVPTRTCVPLRKFMPYSPLRLG